MLLLGCFTCWSSSFPHSKSPPWSSWICFFGSVFYHVMHQDLGKILDPFLPTIASRKILSPWRPDHLLRRSREVADAKCSLMARRKQRWWPRRSYWKCRCFAKLYKKISQWVSIFCRDIQTTNHTHALLNRIYDIDVNVHAHTRTPFARQTQWCLEPAATQRSAFSKMRWQRVRIKQKKINQAEFGSEVHLF